MTKVVNFCAGPSAGKTTNAMALASMMKKNRLNVLYVPEYAMEMVVRNSITTLDDSLCVFAEQAHRLYNAKDQFDWVVTDSPLFLVLHYMKSGNKKFDTGGVYWKYSLKNLVMATFDQYQNYTYFVERGDRKFLQTGRIQDEEQSRAIDGEVLKIMSDNSIDYRVVSDAQQVWDNLVSRGALNG